MDVEYMDEKVYIHMHTAISRRVESKTPCRLLEELAYYGQS